MSFAACSVSFVFVVVVTINGASNFFDAQQRASQTQPSSDDQVHQSDINAKVYRTALSFSSVLRVRL